MAQTSQTSQTSSAEEDNVPRLTAPVAKSAISDIGVQCAVTPSLPAVPSIPTKATAGTQTGPSVSTGDTKEGEVEEIWNSATGSLRRPKRKRRMGAKYKSLQKSTMEVSYSSQENNACRTYKPFTHTTHAHAHHQYIKLQTGTAY